MFTRFAASSSRLSLPSRTADASDWQSSTKSRKSWNPSFIFLFRSTPVVSFSIANKSSKYNFLYLKIVPSFSWAFPARVSLPPRDSASLHRCYRRKNRASTFPCRSQHLAVCWIPWFCHLRKCLLKETISGFSKELVTDLIFALKKRYNSEISTYAQQSARCFSLDLLFRFS